MAVITIQLNHPAVEKGFVLGTGYCTKNNTLVN